MQGRCEGGDFCCIWKCPKVTLIRTGRGAVPKVPEGDCSGQEGPIISRTARRSRTCIPYPPMGSGDCHSPRPHSRPAMRVTNSKGAKARGLGTKKSRALPRMHFHGCGCFGAEGKPGPFRAASPTATGDPSESAEPTTATGPPVFSLELGRCLFTPEPSHCHSQKRGLGCSSLWIPAGSPSRWAKRSLNIPVPPRIQIYTVPGSPPCWTCCYAAFSRYGTRQ